MVCCPATLPTSFEDSAQSILGKQKTAKEIWSCPGLNNHTDSDHLCSVLQACGTDILREGGE